MNIKISEVEEFTEYEIWNMKYEIRNVKTTCSNISTNKKWTEIENLSIIIKIIIYNQYRN